MTTLRTGDASTEYRVRPLVAADAARLQPLNNAAAPAVPITSAHELAALVGFVLALAPGVAYESENYRFFESRDVDHLYVDRIVIAESERGRGLGAILYDAVFEAAREQGRAEVTCEVNLDPPNPGSMAFHRRRGFRELGSQPTKGGTVTVALLSAPL